MRFIEIFYDHKLKENTLFLNFFKYLQKNVYNIYIIEVLRQDKVLDFFSLLLFFFS